MRTTRRVIAQLPLLPILAAVRQGPVAAQAGSRPSITVGALSFTESAILADLIVQVLAGSGITAAASYDLGTSAHLHAALTSGEIDLYVEYTGGGLVAILGLPVPDASGQGAATPAATVADQVYATVSAEYRERFGLVWLDELGFNNSYALAVLPETAMSLGLTSISDLPAHASALTLGTDLEFPERQDGLPGLARTYGLTFGEVVPGDPAAMYEAIANGEVDVISAYTTDGHLRDLDLVFLVDDLGFFPPYRAAPVVRADVLDAWPDLAATINHLAGRIDEESMIAMNAQADLEGVPTRDVARTFLESSGWPG